MSSSPPDPAPTTVSTELLASDEWPDRLRVQLGAAQALAGPGDRDAVLQRIVESTALVAKAPHGGPQQFYDGGDRTVPARDGEPSLA